MRRILVLGVTLLGSISIALAQADTCPDLVQEALDAAETLCSTTERNEACYGNVQIDAELNDASLTFANQGDIIPLSAIETLKLAGLNTDDGTWGVALLRVQADIPDSIPGQNVTFLLFGESEMENLTGTDAPMRAVYFKSGVGSTECADAPDGLLVQTPEGVEEVHFNINGAEVTLGSTAFFQTRLNDEGKPPSLTMSVLEGQGSVTAYGVTQPVFAGSWVRVPIDENFNVSAAPNLPKPYQFDTFDVLPIDVLDEDFTITSSLTQEEIDDRLSELIITTPEEPVAYTLSNTLDTEVEVTLPGGMTVVLQPGETLTADLYPGLHRAIACPADGACFNFVIEIPQDGSAPEIQEEITEDVTEEMNEEVTQETVEETTEETTVEDTEETTEQTTEETTEEHSEETTEDTTEGE